MDSITPIAPAATDADLLRYIALAEQAIYRICGLRPSGRPKLRLIQGGAMSTISDINRVNDNYKRHGPIRPTG